MDKPLNADKNLVTKPIIIRALNYLKSTGQNSMISFIKPPKRADNASEKYRDLVRGKCCHYQ